MKTQNFETHTQHDIFLYVLTLIVLVLWVCIWYTAKQLNIVAPLNWLQYILPVLVPLFLIALLMKMRRYATTLQDRIIRQEVKYRHFVATGKTLSESITMWQIIWLRFAWDSEFIALVNKAESNPTLTWKEIKQQVKNWKGDFNRV